MFSRMADDPENVRIRLGTLEHAMRTDDGKSAADLARERHHATVVAPLA
jgi:hypothetical protein